MDLSVIICTRNRAAQLFDCLSSMTKLKILHRVSSELIVVDNGSADNTVEILSSFQRLLPLKRVLHQEPGKSKALNWAINTAVGKYFILSTTMFSLTQIG